MLGTTGTYWAPDVLRREPNSRKILHEFVLEGGKYSKYYKYIPQVMHFSMLIFIIINIKSKIKRNDFTSKDTVSLITMLGVMLFLIVWENRSRYLVNIIPLLLINQLNGIEVCIIDYDYEIICVNDGSKDKTLQILEKIAESDKNVKVLSFARNFGHQCAVTAGLKEVTGDVVVIIDADLQDPPELIPQMLKLWEEGNEVVYGKRKTRDGESKFKLLTAKMFYKTLNALSDVDIPKDTGDFRLVDRKIVDQMNNLPEHNKFLRGLWSWLGYKQCAFEYERKERFAGQTKYPLKKMLKLASDGIIGFSTKPLKLVGGLGIISILISLVILIYSILSYIFSWGNLTAGWTSIMVAITLFSGVQLLSLWIIAEYIGRIYDETKQRPQYIIDKKINIK